MFSYLQHQHNRYSSLSHPHYPYLRWTYCLLVLSTEMAPGGCNIQLSMTSINHMNNPMPHGAITIHMAKPLLKNVLVVTWVIEYCTSSISRLRSPRKHLFYHKKRPTASFTIVILQTLLSLFLYYQLSLPSFTFRVSHNIRVVPR